MLRLFAIGGLVVSVVGLGGCVVAPPYGYAYAPPGYGYAPGYYAAPSVSIGVGFSGGYGGYGHGWHR